MPQLPECFAPSIMMISSAMPASIKARAVVGPPSTRRRVTPSAVSRIIGEAKIERAIRRRADVEKARAASSESGPRKERNLRRRSKPQEPDPVKQPGS